MNRIALRVSDPKQYRLRGTGELSGQRAVHFNQGIPVTAFESSAARTLREAGKSALCR